MLGLAQPLIKPALGPLASAGLSFGAEKVLKKMFGKGFGPKEIELYKFAQMDDSCSETGGGTISCWTRCCKGRRRTTRRFPWYVSVHRDTFGYRLSQKDTQERLANSTTMSTSLPTAPTSKGKRNANATPTSLRNVG